ncbi:MAG: Zn-ribbon domain-containing OB-fold protein [Burkholderiales bacterium]
MATVQPESVDAPFWRSTGGKLLIKRCRACGELHHYPRTFCPFCMSDDVAWLESRGTGKVYSFSITRPKDGPPYVIAFVTLDEGISLMTHIVDAPPESVAVDQPVEVVFRDMDGVSTPVFRRIA